MIPLVYQKLLDSEISKKRSKIKEFSLFANFVIKLKTFELTYDCLILYFPVVFPVYNICRKFHLVSMNVSKGYRLSKIEKISLRPRNFTIFEILTLLFGKIEFSPLKKLFSFFNHRDI